MIRSMWMMIGDVLNSGSERKKGRKEVKTDKGERDVDKNKQ